MSKLASGHSIEKLTGEELKEQQRNFKSYEYDLMRLHPGRWFLPLSFTELSSDIYNFKVSSNFIDSIFYTKINQI